MEEEMERIKRANEELAHNMCLIDFTNQGRQVYMIVAKRPNIDRYLAQLNSIGNLYLYTSATRDYAIRVLKEIDPSNRLFANRIFAQENPM